MRREFGIRNGRKPYLFPQKKFVSVFYAINIFNTIYYFIQNLKSISELFKMCTKSLDSFILASCDY